MKRLISHRVTAIAGGTVSEWLALFVASGGAGRPIILGMIRETSVLIRSWGGIEVGGIFFASQKIMFS